MKIDITKKPKKTRDLHDKVKHLIHSMEGIDGGFRVMATTEYRKISAMPPMEIINSSLDDVLNDINTVDTTHKQNLRRQDGAI